MTTRHEPDPERGGTRPITGRRPFLKMMLGGVAASGLRRGFAATAPYRVAVARSPDAYTATRAAVAASGEWPAGRIPGQTVFIKTNLVLPMATETGGTTSPHVVRALVDLALEGGADRVLIAEGGRQQAPFRYCGYNLFRNYDPDGRVQIVDLAKEPSVAVLVPAGFAHKYVHLPAVAFATGAVFVSAAKLKTHVETGATLSMKNLFGMPPVGPYFDPVQDEWRSRYRLHDRGVHQAIVDLNLARPVDFAVVDGIWGMEGEGPDLGTPIRVDLVVAGRNALAVDRICLDIMGMPQTRVQHLNYGAMRGLGPNTLGQIEVVGDGYVPHPFLLTAIPPQVWLPVANPQAFSPGNGGQSALTYKLNQPAETRVEVMRSTDITPSFTRLRLLRDWAPRAVGFETLSWDGRDDAGQRADAGTYAVRVQSRENEGAMVSGGTGWVTVV
jgi:uncharacterized protein (DUF362 family)